MNAPQEKLYVIVDADCPGCGWPERRVLLENLSIVYGELLFECRKCDYVSPDRNK